MPKQLILPGEIIKKRNELIRSKINISNVLSSRILANLIACIRHDDTRFQDTYQIPIKDFIVDSGGNSYGQIRAACRELAKATAEFETTDIKSAQPKFTVTPFFSEIEYHKGTVTATFNQKMQPMLLELKQCFTKYNLIEYLALPSIYSQRLFEILKSWSNTTDVTLTMDELHHLLSTPESFRKDFKAFRVRVLEKAHKDILKYTNLEFEWKPIKQGRAVVAVHFFFGKKFMLAHQKEEKQTAVKKQVSKNNKLFLDVRACRKQKQLAQGIRCPKPDCSKRQQAVCCELFE